jgi:hypothetical protein
MNIAKWRRVSDYFPGLKRMQFNLCNLFFKAIMDKMPLNPGIFFAGNRLMEKRGSYSGTTESYLRIFNDGDNG